MQAGGQNIPTMSNTPVAAEWNRFLITINQVIITFLPVFLIPMFEWAKPPGPSIRHDKYFVGNFHGLRYFGTASFAA